MSFEAPDRLEASPAPKPKPPEREVAPPVAAPPARSGALFDTGMGAGIGPPSASGLLRQLARSSVTDRKAGIEDLNDRVGNRRTSRMISHWCDGNEPRTRDESAKSDLQIALKTATDDQKPELQKAIGNRATVVLARRLSIKPNDLAKKKEGNKESREQIKLIRKALVGYESIPTAAARVQVLGFIEARIEGYRDAGGPTNSQQGQLLFNLLTEVQHELVEMKAQSHYMSDLAKGRSEFKYMSTFAPLAVTQAEQLAKGETSADAIGEDEESLRVMKEQGLTDAEIAAVKIYTVGDFAYINPALAGSEDPKSSARKWLKETIENALDIVNDVTEAGLQRATVEGRRHGHFFMKAFEKLPKYAGGAWRGTRRSRAAFDKEFVAGKDVSSGSFLSMSRRRAISENFAYNPQKKDPADVVSVMMACKLTDSRDVAGLSLKRDEAEVVLAPGARLRIDKVETDLLASDARPTGIPAYVVHCTQIA